MMCMSCLCYPLLVSMWRANLTVDPLTVTDSTIEFWNEVPVPLYKVLNKTLKLQVDTELGQRCLQHDMSSVEAESMQPCAIGEHIRKRYFSDIHAAVADLVPIHVVDQNPVLW